LGLEDHPLAGGGVLLRDLDHGLLDGHQPAQEVDVPRTKGDQLSPPQPGLDVGQDEVLEAVGDLS
jgi:hypothetical protein